MIELEKEKYEALKTPTGGDVVVPVSLLRRLYDAEDAVDELVRGVEKIHEASNEFRTRDIAVRLIGRYKRDD